MPCALELRQVVGHVATREDPAVHGRVQRHDAVAEQVAEPGQVLERRHRDPLVREHLRRAGAREQLDAEPGELARERGEAGLVVDREERAADRHAAISSFTTSGQEPVLDGLDAGAQRLGRVARLDRDRLARITGPVSTPSSTQWTVAAVSGTPAASTSSIGCAPGNAGSGAECVLTTRRPKTSKKPRPQQVHVAGEHGELDAALQEPARERLVALLAGRVGVGRRRPRSRCRPPRRAPSARTPARFDATATIGRPASMSAWRFVPSPLTSTPITRRSTRRRRRPPRAARSRDRERPTSAAGTTAQ